MTVDLLLETAGLDLRTSAATTPLYTIVAAMNGKKNLLVIFVAFADVLFTVGAIYSLDAHKAAPINPTC